MTLDARIARLESELRDLKARRTRLLEHIKRLHRADCIERAKDSIMADLTGTRYGRLVALSPVPTGNWFRRWLCACDCGNIHEVDERSLRRGHSRSCGCWKREQASAQMSAMNRALSADEKRRRAQHATDVRAGRKVAIPPQDELTRALNAIVKGKS